MRGKMWKPGVIALTALAAMASGVDAARLRLGGCEACCAPAPCASVCEPAVVHRTVMVPETTYETRKVTVTKYRREQRQKQVTVQTRVPVRQTRTCNYTVMVPHQTTRTVNYVECVPVQTTKTVAYTVKKPVWTTKTVHYTVCVPEQVERQGVKRVARRVVVEKTRTVCVDQGHWEERPVAPCGGCNACGSCGGCGSCGAACAPATCKVWVSNLVKKEVPYKVCQTVCEDVPYTYTVTKYRREPRTKEVKVCRYECERRTKEVNCTTYQRVTKTKEVACTVRRPEQRTREIQVVTYQCVPQQRTVNYTVCVPYQTECEVRVPVCRMVEKVVACPAPACCG